MKARGKEEDAVLAGDESTQKQKSKKRKAVESSEPNAEHAEERGKCRDTAELQQQLEAHMARIPDLAGPENKRVRISPSTVILGQVRVRILKKIGRLKAMLNGEEVHRGSPSHSIAASQTADRKGCAKKAQEEVVVWRQSSTTTELN